MTYKGERALKVGQALDGYSEIIATGISLAGAAIGVFVPKEVTAAGADGAAKQIGDCAESNLRSIAARKACVVDALGKSEKTVLVVIDDIDRLPNDRIRLVFQLVASIANFPGVNYLLLYDRRIVVNALQEVQRGFGEECLEKIIQVPLRIPEISRLRIAELLYREISSSIYPDTNRESRPDGRLRDVVDSCVLDHVVTLRDMKRYLNALDFELQYTRGRVDCADLVGIVAIKVFQPKLYLWVMRHRGRVVETDIYKPDGHYSFDLRKTKSSIIDECTMTEDEAGRAMAALCSIFPKLAQGLNVDVDRYVDKSFMRVVNRLGHADVFDLYRTSLLEEDSFPLDLVRKIAYEYDAGGLSTYLSEQLQQGAEDVFYGIYGLRGSLDGSRPEEILKGLLQAMSGAYSIDSKVNGNSWAIRLISVLMRGAGKVRGGEIMLRIIASFNLDGLLALGHWLYDQCNAFGYFDGEFDRLSQLMTEDEFAALCQAYSELLESESEDENVFARPYPKAAMLVWLAVDKERCEGFLRGAFRRSDCWMSFVGQYCTRATDKNGELEWQVDWGFKDFISVQEASMLNGACLEKTAMRADGFEGLVAFGIALSEESRTKTRLSTVKHSAVRGKLAAGMSD